MIDDKKYTFLQKNVCVKFYSLTDYHIRPVVCAWERTSPRKYPVGPWKLTNYIVHFILDGEGVCYYENKKYVVEKGAIFAIAPGKTVSYMQNPDNPWRSIWIEINGADCGTLFEQSGLGSDVFVKTVSDYDKFAEMFLNAMNDGNLNEDPQGFIMLSNVYRIFAEIAAEFASIGSQKTIKTQLVEKIVDYIDKNYGNDISAGTIAKTFFVSPQYLSRIFRREIKTSPQAYLTSVRLAKPQKCSPTEILPFHPFPNPRVLQVLITFRKCSRKNISFRPRNTAPANKPRKNRRNSTPYRKIRTDRRINVCQTRIKYKLPHKVCRLHGKTMRKIKSIATKKGRIQPFFLFYCFCCVPEFKTVVCLAYECKKC